MSRPSAAASEFEKWTYDTAILTGVGCWQRAYPELREAPEVYQQRPRRTGSYRLPGSSEEAQVCRSFAQEGIKPRCTNAFVTMPGARHNPGLPREYIQFPPNGAYMVGVHSEIKGGLDCHLTSAQTQSQFYAGRLQVIWRTAPTRRSFNTPSGPSTLEAGTVEVRSAGAPGPLGREFSQIRTAVVVR